jgi:hypothetical protein
VGSITDLIKDCTIVVRKFVGTIIDLIKDYNCCSEDCGYYHRSDEILYKFFSEDRGFYHSSDQRLQLLFGRLWVLS